LVAAYTLLALENLGTLLRPYFLGTAVDDLLAGSYRGLLRLSALHLAWLVVGTVRHMYDTRAFTAVYTRFVTQLLTRRVDDPDVSKRAAHATLAGQFVEFLQHDINYVIEALYNLVGSVVLLLLYNRRVALICLVVLVPVLRLSTLYGRKTGRLSLERHDEVEKQVAIIASHDPQRIRAHYLRLRACDIRLSDQEAWNFGAMELLVLTVIAFALLVSTEGAQGTVQAGSIIGIYNYILKFASGLDTIPYTIQRLASLKDLTRRMALGETDMADGTVA
jgi:ABC-type multidrug transport system fused ATPase/permease subunit